MISPARAQMIQTKRGVDSAVTLQATHTHVLCCALVLMIVVAFVYFFPLPEHQQKRKGNEAASETVSISHLYDRRYFCERLALRLVVITRVIIYEVFYLSIFRVLLNDAVSLSSPPAHYTLEILSCFFFT